MSTLSHQDTGEPTVIVYNGYPGGAGFADRGHEAIEQWLTAVRDTVAGCPCESGCPSCVQSPACGNGNHPLDKAGAVVVLRLVVEALAADTCIHSVSDSERCPTRSTEADLLYAPSATDS